MKWIARTVGAGVGAGIIGTILVFSPAQDIGKRIVNYSDAPSYCSGNRVVFSGKMYTVPFPEYRSKSYSAGVTAVSETSPVKGYSSIVRKLKYPVRNQEDMNCWAEAIRIENKKVKKDFLKPGDRLSVPDKPN